MLTRALAALVSLTLLAAAGCSPDANCVSDSDCFADEYCASNGVCRKETSPNPDARSDSDTRAAADTNPKSDTPSFDDTTGDGDVASDVAGVDTADPPDTGCARDGGCSCDYSNTSAGVCGTAVVDPKSGMCQRPSDFEIDESTCDGKDNDCDGDVDEKLEKTYYHDKDGDGFGDPEDSETACSRPANHVQKAKDCDDDDAKAKPMQENWFEQPREGGSFDYDCDTDVTPQHPDPHKCIGRSESECRISVAGWKGRPPDCGDSGEFVTSCVWKDNFMGTGMGACVASENGTTQETQACH